MCNKAKEHFREVFELQANVHFLGFTGMSVCVHLSWAYRSTNFTHRWMKPSARSGNRKFGVVQLLSCVWLFATPWIAACQASIFHYLLEFTQTHVHRVSDAIQPSHPLSSSSPPAFNLSQHQGLFKWVSSPHQVDTVLEFQLQHQSFQWTPRTDLL